jgi:hypothetical protein
VRMRMRRGHGIDRKCGGLQFRIHCRNLVLCVCPCVCAGARARKSRDNKRGRILSTIDGSQPRSTALSMHITSSIKKIQKQCWNFQTVRSNSKCLSIQHVLVG